MSVRSDRPGAASGTGMVSPSADTEVANAVARLAEAAASGRPVEVIFAVRGTVRPVDGPTGRRWRIRIDRDRVVTFRAEWVLAASPVPAGEPRKR